MRSIQPWLVSDLSSLRTAASSQLAEAKELMLDALASPKTIAVILGILLIAAGIVWAYKSWKDTVKEALQNKLDRVRENIKRREEQDEIFDQKNSVAHMLAAARRILRKANRDRS